MELTDEIAGFGPLEPLLADAAVTEVMVNGPGCAYVERAGCLESVALDLDAAGIIRLVERVVAPLGLRLDRSSPMVDARLPDGSRVHAIIPPLAIDGPCVTIRRFGARAIPLDAFGLDTEAAGFLRWCVEAGWNLLVAGGTSAGKTTLLNALSAAIPEGERIVTIEETAELRLAQTHVVRLEARPPNAEGVGAVAVRDLVRAALRMRPDRIVVGEVRGGEALDMLQALNTGHDGSLSTVHANSAVDALRASRDAGSPRRHRIAARGDPRPSSLPRSTRSCSSRGVGAGGGAWRASVRSLRTVSIAGLRPLFTRGAHALEPQATPSRAPRRPDAPPYVTTDR